MPKTTVEHNGTLEGVISTNGNKRHHRSDKSPKAPSVLESQEVTPSEWNFVFKHFIKGYDLNTAFNYAWPQWKKTQIKSKVEYVTNLLKLKRFTDCIANMRAEAMLGGQLTLDQHLHHLARIRDKALKKEDMASAVSAQKLIGQACGHHDQKISVDHHHHADENAVKAEIAKLLRENPELLPPPELKQLPEMLTVQVVDQDVDEHHPEQSEHRPQPATHPTEQA